MTKKLTLLALIFLIVFIASSSLTLGPVAAQSRGQITVGDSSIQMEYPNNMNFSCRITADSNITSVRLQYEVEQMTFAQVISEADVTFTSANSVNANYSLNMLRYGQIPQGIGVDYWWIIKDAAGNKLQTDSQRYVVSDNQYAWRMLTQNKINLFWYGQNETFGQAIMSEAQSVLSRLAADTRAIPDHVVNLSIYTSERDYAGSVTGASEWSGGVTLPGYNSIILLVRPNNFNADVSGVAHELTHVIVAQVTFNPYNNEPFWLTEGLAMYIQYPDGRLPSQFTIPFEDALNNDTLISMRSLSDPFSAYPEKAFLSYAESYSVISYLIDQYGPDRMLQFLNIFKQGMTYDSALRSIYGLDMDGLFNQWSTWLKTQAG